MATSYTSLNISGQQAANSAALAVEAQFNAVVATLANMETTMTSGTTSVNVAQVHYGIYLGLGASALNLVVAILTAYDPAYTRTGPNPTAPSYYTATTTASSGAVTGTGFVQFSGSKSIAGAYLDANTAYTVTWNSTSSVTIAPTTGITSGTGIVIF